MKISTGFSLAGFPVTEHKFQGVTTLNQIEGYGLVRPTKAASAGKKSDERTQKAGQLHNEHQRRFDKARLARVDAYSGYIEAVEVNGQPGGTPAMTLYIEQPLVVDDGGMVIPYSAILTAIDGETQTEARFQLRDRMPETGENPIAVTVYCGLDSDVARQILHDYNAKAHPVTERETAAFNKTGPLSIAINRAIDAAGIPLSSINRNGGKATKKTLVAHPQLLNCAAGYQLNGQGLDRNVTPNHLSTMNDINAVLLSPAFSDQLAAILVNAKINHVIGKAPQQVWQVAGVAISGNRQANSLNWAAACAAYDATVAKGRGGVRVSVKERLAAIAQAI